MISPDSRAYRARRQAEIPLSVLFKFASPALIVVVALSATRAVDARTHHRVSKTSALAATTKPDAKIPVEVKRDPADVALDRKIKGICNGC